MNLKLLFIGTWDLNQNELVTPGLDDDDGECPHHVNGAECFRC